MSPGPEASSAQARGLLFACSQLEAGFLGDPILLQGVLQHRKAPVRHRQGGGGQQDCPSTSLQSRAGLGADSSRVLDLPQSSPWLLLLVQKVKRSPGRTRQITKVHGLYSVHAGTGARG